MLSEQFKTIKTYEPFILGTCQCPCSTELPSLISKKKSRDKHGWLRKYLNSTHSLKGKNQSGENNPMWKGGQPKQDKDGYWLIYKPEHPNKNNENRVFLHRLLYEDYLSIIFDEPMYLPEGSEIHHINGNKEDNSLANLQYMDNHKEHAQEHLREYNGIKCKTCGTSETSKRKDNGRPRWQGNEIDGYNCELCEKKKYYIENKERISQSRKERWLKNKDEINKRKRELYKKNKKK